LNIPIRSTLLLVACISNETELEEKTEEETKRIVVMSKEEELPVFLNNLLRLLVSSVPQWLQARTNITLARHPWLELLSSGGM
jgi:hypothetical protein